MAPDRLCVFGLAKSFARLAAREAMTMRQSLAVSAILATALLLAGCVSLHVQSRDGQVRTVRHFGILHVQLANPEQAIVGSLSGVGLVGAPLGWSLGYTRQRWALMGPECRAVVWLDEGNVNSNTSEALAQVAGLCLISNSATSNSSQTVHYREKTP
jgi:outer membrane lipoprotein SlyB